VRAAGREARESRGCARFAPRARRTGTAGLPFRHDGDEAVYFHAEDDVRTALLFIDVKDASDMPGARPARAGATGSRRRSCRRRRSSRRSSA
jgi:hypothetical protein